MFWVLGSLLGVSSVFSSLRVCELDWCVSGVWVFSGSGEEAGFRGFKDKDIEGLGDLELRALGVYG